MLKFGTIFQFKDSQDYWDIRSKLVKHPRKSNLNFRTSANRINIKGQNNHTDELIRQAIHSLNITDYEEFDNDHFG